MGIYKKRTSSKVYRRIYEQHYGPIPRENDGRTYEIHHIDGDDSNNSPENLVALTIKDHYKLHFSQGDYGAAVAISRRMKMAPDEVSTIHRLHQLQLIEEGKHHFITDNPVYKQILSDAHPFQKRKDGSSLSMDRVLNGTCVLLKKNDGSSIGAATTKKLVENGTHNFQKRKDGTSLQSDRLNDGSHHLIGDTNPNHTRVCCMECCKEVSRPMFTRWHGINCKEIDPDGHKKRASQVTELNKLQITGNFD